MNSLNSILLEGNLTRDPDGKATPKGVPVCTFTIASNRFYNPGDGVQKETSFFDVETWSGLAERCSIELKKGRGVRVVGRLKQERWQDPEGKGRVKVKVVAEHVEFKPIFARKEQEQAIEDDENEASVVLEEQEMESVL